MLQSNIPEIRCEQQSWGLSITLHRPERKNALSQAMYAELADLINQAADDDSIAVLVLQGAEHCFTAGNDLQDFALGKDLAGEDNPIFCFMKAWLGFHKPTVVACEGFAVGIGSTLLMYADFVYAHPDTVFKMPFVQLGLCPEFGSSFVLPRIVGAAVAKDWLMTGRAFSAQEALNAGFITAVSDEPINASNQQAARMAGLPKQALIRTKSLIDEPNKLGLEEVIRNEIEVFCALLQGDEFKQAVTAFFNKNDKK